MANQIYGGTYPSTPDLSVLFDMPDHKAKEFGDRSGRIGSGHFGIRSKVEGIADNIDCKNWDQYCNVFDMPN